MKRLDHRIRTFALVLLLPVALGAAACGDDDKPSGDAGDADVAQDVTPDIGDVDQGGDPAIDAGVDADVPVGPSYNVLDIAPNSGTRSMFVDPTTLVTVVFELDVTGTELPLNGENPGMTHAPTGHLLVDCSSAEDCPDFSEPRCTGGVCECGGDSICEGWNEGTPAIVGNQDSLANWSPNNVFMTDDGVAPDETAGDGIWTIAFGFPPGTSLQYKFTIGTEGAGWGPTEEFPLTNRGYDIPTDGTSRVRIRDVFADEPSPSGSQGSLTEIVTSSEKSMVPPGADFYVWTEDGADVRVLFIEAVDESDAETVGNYTLTAADESTATITSATLDGDDAAYVVLALGSALDDSQTWELEVANITPAGGGDDLAGTEDVMATNLLNIIWHQHQPSYLDPFLDELQGPWVRKHAQKDYFDMTAILRQYTDVHFNVNLTSSLLQQLELYIERLGPYVDLENNTFDEDRFFGDGMEGHTDPWVDLLLNDTPTPEAATDVELGRFFADVWSCRSIADPLLSFFPEYQTLARRDEAVDPYSQLELMTLKLWFEVAWFDPDFLRGEVSLYQDGDDNWVTLDLSDVVDEDENGRFTFVEYYTDDAQTEAELLARGEALANRLVAENYKVMVATFSVHNELLRGGTGDQIDVLTTPFYHPILPLLYDTDLAAEGAPNDPLPNPNFAYLEDVETQIALAVAFYTRTFGQAPRGMWPSEGAVAEEIIGAFTANQIEYIATDMKVLQRGLGNDASHLFAYMVDEDTVEGDGGSSDDEMMIVFRDTPLSDKVGFAFQGGAAQDNADEFLADVLSMAPRFGEEEQLLSVILDGENAWEWYSRDHDAKGFHHALYQNLTTAFERGLVITTTGTEYIDGNAARGIDAHPVTDLREYEDLFPASWINGNLDTWIGESEENQAWDYLRTARDDIAAADELLDITLDDPPLDPPDESDTDAYAWWSAWHAIYSAEGSDWFWWYGSDQTSAGNADDRFDQIFRAQLVAMYVFMNEALEENGHDPFPIPAFTPIIQPPSDPFSEEVPFTTAPTLDGALTPDIEEWIPPAGAFWDIDSSTGADPRDDIQRVMYGYQGTGEDTMIYIGIFFDQDMSEKLETDYRVAIYTNHGNVNDAGGLDQDPFNDRTEEGVTASFRSGGPARQIVLDFSGSSVEARVSDADGDGGWVDTGGHSIQIGGPAGDGDLLELEIPMIDLGMSVAGPFLGDPLEFLLVASEY